MEVKERIRESDTEPIYLHQTLSYVVTKRIIDICISLILLLLLAPFLLLVALIIFLNDGKPIIYKQVRVGKNGHHFVILKFRSMNERKKSRKSSKHSPNPILWANGIPENYIHKSKMTDEVTRVGRFLRKYSIDELPQLINVLRGDMSIVGPRPEVPDITKYYNNKQQKRLSVKPGITGYAQVMGRSNINHGQKIDYDLYYIKNCSFLMDMKIIYKSIICVIKTDGAY